MAKSKVESRSKFARQLGTILVPVDFSEASEGAFRASLDIARASSRIILQHVVAPSRSGARYVSSLKTAARKSLLAFSKLAKPDHDHSVKLLVCVGIPFQEILDAARKYNVELIVLGLNGLQKLTEVALGRTVDLVSRHAKCPVLLTRTSQSSAVAASTQSRSSAIRKGTSNELRQKMLRDSQRSPRTPVRNSGN